MAQIVDTKSLFVRSSPDKVPGNIVGALSLGDSVTIIAPPAAGSQFCQVNCQINGQAVTGFVSELFLRDPVSPAREALISEAIKEWHRFHKGLGKEHVAPFFRFVGQMWQAIGINLDGHDRDQPWSAAAISFMVRNASQQEPAYGNFKFASAHSRYIHDAIVKQNSGNQNTPFWGFQLTERRPQLGDMVCRWREREVDFETASRIDAFKSHCDIIVKIDSPGNKVWAIGGNVSHSVSITEYDLGPGDFLDDSNQVFALLANIV